MSGILVIPLSVHVMLQNQAPWPTFCQLAAQEHA